MKAFLHSQGVLLDVRSPKEYAQGHIPGALSLPLFSDAERAHVGTLYKFEGKERAFDAGIEIVSPKIASFIAKGREYLRTSPLLKIYCWRGGLRSSSLKKIFEIASLPSTTLPGGYKVFRRWALQELSLERKWRVLGGLTGSGKTKILQILSERGEAVLDFEKLAHHRGSAYGMLGHLPQPTNEQFENEIASLLSSFSTKKPLWVEDESRLLGRCKIPDPLFIQMCASPLFLISATLQNRLTRLLEEYASFKEEELLKATQRLEKRLGRERTIFTLKAIKEKRFEEAISSILYYYDRTYREGLSKRKGEIYTFEESDRREEEWADILLGYESLQ